MPVIEDCAQSLGAEYKSRRVGSLGELSVFSFYATKMITTGEGGMILTDDEERRVRLIELRDYDKKSLVPYEVQLQDDRSPGVARPQSAEQTPQLHRTKGVYRFPIQRCVVAIRDRATCSNF